MIQCLSFVPFASSASPILIASVTLLVTTANANATSTWHSSTAEKSLDGENRAATRVFTLQG